MIRAFELERNFNAILKNECITSAIHFTVATFFSFSKFYSVQFDK